MNAPYTLEQSILIYAVRAPLSTFVWVNYYSLCTDTRALTASVTFVTDSDSDTVTARQQPRYAVQEETLTS